MICVGVRKILLGEKKRQRDSKPSASWSADSLLYIKLLTKKSTAIRLIIRFTKLNKIRVYKQIEFILLIEKLKSFLDTNRKIENFVKTKFQS